ncbi:MAG: hypothetical protein WD267_00290 [Balneolales bacterium]
MRNKAKSILTLYLTLLFASGIAASNVNAQERIEPDVIPIDSPKTYSDVDFNNGIGFGVQLHNYGAGLGAQYRRVLGPMTEGIFEFHLSTLKDETEQTFSWYGQQIIPNKYNRILNAPILFGVKHRIFPRSLNDNFRVYLQGVVGPTVAFVYPYFNDTGIGYRQPNQFPNDIFQGWGDGYFTWGTAGHLSLGVDFGDNFSKIQSVNFGYYFHYFEEGIQIMEPNTPVAGETGSDPQSYFGSPKISFVFGGMW